jgi:hypothetical protein
MTTSIQTHGNNAIRIALLKESDTFIERHTPRRRLVVSIGLMLAGLSVPLLIAMQLLTFTISVGFVGFALAATGGVLTLIFWGEI